MVSHRKIYTPHKRLLIKNKKHFIWPIARKFILRYNLPMNLELERGPYTNELELVTAQIANRVTVHIRI